MALGTINRNLPAALGLLAVFNDPVLRGIDWVGGFFTASRVIDLASRPVALAQTLVTVLGVVLIVWNERRLASERISSAEEAAARQLASASTELRGAVEGVRVASDATAARLVNHASAIEALALVQFLERSKALLDEAAGKFEEAWKATLQNALRPGAGARDARHLDQGMRLQLLDLKQLVRDRFAFQWPDAHAPSETLIPPDGSQIANSMLRDAFKRAWALHERETRNMAAMHDALGIDNQLRLAQERVRAYLLPEAAHGGAGPAGRAEAQEWWL